MLGGPLAEDRGFILHTPPSDFSSSIRISDNTVTDLRITRLRDNFELLKDPFHLQIFQRLIDNNAHGTLVVINKPLENLQVEGILEKLKIVPEPRNPEIRLDKPF
jgi:putative AlgH/UPF0301 family transcriptional regulator